ncbi:hypothetical protein [Absidia glauca]|uniref:AMP-dependent synthetase/ligase domain-containing protein n=1 Tax=Absidia glauca TaxID=4829 RepID=A0A168M6C1_ABSGL|nr:hypothetical protein [Absidia glauca]
MVIYKSSCHPVDIPSLDIFSFLFTANDQNTTISHDRPLLIDAVSGKSFSYAQVRSLSLKLAAGWKKNVGLKKGQVVAVFAPNQHDHAILYFSLLAAGCTISPGNPSYTEDEFNHQVHTSGATTIVTVPSLLPVLTKVADKNGISKHNMFVFGDQQVDHARCLSQVASSNEELAYPDTSIDPENDLAFIMFSSGTTGVAKGVMLSHSNFVSQVLSVMTFEKEDGAIGESDIMLAFLPFYHIFGLTTLILRAVYALTPVVIMEKFDLERYCQLIQKYKVTVAPLVPPIAVLLAKSPIVPNYDLTSLRMITSGAAPLGKEHIEQLHKRIKATVRQGYGLSESTSGFIYQSVKSGDVGATGRLVSHAVVKLVDPDDNEMGDDQPGELLLKGPFQMKGYINNKKANDETFTSDGWMRTGDVAKFDSKTQEFYIVDRIKELIKYKGLQVAPAELESLLMGHDKVADSCVVGVYDAAQATELPRAYVVLAATVKPSDALAQELLDYVSGKVVSHKKLRGGIRFVDAIPKSPSGKILRREIKDWIKKEEERALVRARL